MKAFWKKGFAFLKKPPLWGIILVFLLAVGSITAALVCVFMGFTGVFVYTMYALAAISLGYSTYLLVRVAPVAKKGIMERLQKGKFTRVLVGDYSFRTLVFVTFSLVINACFVLFNTVLACMTNNVWYGGLAGYYFLLGGLRSLVFFWNKRAKKAEGREISKLQWRNYGFCGGALLALNVALSVVVTFMVLQQKPTKYNEVMAIAFAAYAFYKITLAIYNLFKAKKTKDLQIQAFRNIGLVDAAVSILSLQTALIATFSTDGGGMLALNAIMGATVCLLNIGIGVYMIVQSVRHWRKKGGVHE